MRFVALDTETTGVNPRTDRIIELCLREVTWPDLELVVELVFRVNPGIPIPDEATEVHGITDADIEDQPFFHQIAEKVQKFIEGAFLIGYNGRRFDVPLLHFEFVRAGHPGLPVQQPIIDPLELFRQDRPHTLTGAVAYYLQEQHERAHSAHHDVDAMLRVLQTQLKTRKARDVLDEALLPEKLPITHGNVFYEDPYGVICFGFGKHRDKPIAAYPAYLQWMLRQNFDATVKSIARQALSVAAA